MHMAASAVINAVWDFTARAVNKPLWRLLADLNPEDLGAQVDFRYLPDALTEQEAFELPTAAKAGRADREGLPPPHGYPAYATTPGWIGYDDAWWPDQAHTWPTTPTRRSPSTSAPSQGKRR